jgi:hypothetical protein
MMVMAEKIWDLTIMISRDRVNILFDIDSLSVKKKAGQSTRTFFSFSRNNSYNIKKQSNIPYNTA